MTDNTLIEQARALALRPGRAILGITGAPASGKSTLADAVVAELGPSLAALVPMDGFHLDDEVLRRHGSWERKGAIDTFDGAGYASLLHRLRDQQPGETVFAPRFDRSSETSIAGAIEIGADVPLLVTEGNYLLAEEGAWPAARAALDEVWFLQIDAGLRRERLTERHMLFGRSPDEAHERTWGSDEANARMIEALASRADRVIAI